ncbi:hypothetical protein DPMN_014718 [Dreissena polymorpha]|uniref:Uncharacterized protein n=1 Tax=Dreissena polymorpha TaxID=45954 RepID=A0A9D4N9W8_DREPO|nr:hypothetical protein DPMN_014718 [Dreissena polymorpha]
MRTRVSHSGGVACEAKRCDVTRQSYRKAVTFVYAPMLTCTQRKVQELGLAIAYRTVIFIASLL